MKRSITTSISSIVMCVSIGAGNAFGIPCATTYELYRDELLADGFTPVPCKKLNEEKMIWNELCEENRKKGIFYSTWIDDEKTNQYRFPVTLTFQRGLCVIASVFLKDIDEMEVKDIFNSTNPNPALKL